MKIKTDELQAMPIAIKPRKSVGNVRSPARDRVDQANVTDLTPSVFPLLYTLNITSFFLMQKFTFGYIVCKLFFVWIYSFHEQIFEEIYLENWSKIQFFKYIVQTKLFFLRICSLTPLNSSLDNTNFISLHKKVSIIIIYTIFNNFQDIWG